MMEAYGVSLFCEDIRDEIGGKRSLIGTFNSELYVQQFPIVLPKLAVITTLYLPLDVKIVNYEWCIYFPGDDPTQPSFKTQAEAETTPLPQNGSTAPPEWLDEDVEKAQKIVQSVVFSPVQLMQPGLIKVRAAFGDLVVRAGVLRVGRMLSQLANETSIIAS